MRGGSGLLERAALALVGVHRDDPAVVQAVHDADLDRVALAVPAPRPDLAQQDHRARRDVDVRVGHDLEIRPELGDARELPQDRRPTAKGPGVSGGEGRRRHREYVGRAELAKCGLEWLAVSSEVVAGIVEEAPHRLDVRARPAHHPGREPHESGCPQVASRSIRPTGLLYIKAPSPDGELTPLWSSGQAETEAFTTGSAQMPYLPAPSGKYLPCACTRRPARTGRRAARPPGAPPSSSRAGHGRTPPASAPRACGRGGTGPPRAPDRWRRRHVGSAPRGWA